MNAHITEWLAAYHDGEVTPAQRRQIEAHLLECTQCREELASLEALRAVLHESPSPTLSMTAKAFTAQIVQQLPDHAAPTSRQPTLPIGWWLAPLGIFGAQALVQTTFFLSNTVLAALRLGLQDNSTIASLIPPVQQLSVSDLLSFSNGSLFQIGHAARQLLRHGGPLGWGALLNLAFLAMLGLLYTSWMATWWSHSRNHPKQTQVT